MKKVKVHLILKNVDLELIPLIKETIDKYNKAKTEHDRKALGLAT